MDRSDTVSNESEDRARACLWGLAAGDALGAPTEGMSRAAIRARFGSVSGFLTEDQAGTDDTEYAVLSAWTAITHGRASTAADTAATWRTALAQQDRGFAGAGFSEMIALGGLLDRRTPPDTGIRNAERDSDGAAMRVAPWGILCAGDAAEACRLAAEDAAISHYGDGIHAARAMAAAVSAAMTGAPWAAVRDAAVDALPADSWTRRWAVRALDIARAEDDPDAVDAHLLDELALPHYPWADLAPEALALALGILQSRRADPVPCILAGVNIGRDSDTIAAMAGAIAGAMTGTAALPAAWTERVDRVRGRCITATAGTRLSTLASRLVGAA
ncbi:hypothetical protein GCM10027058_18450 [Microbacterium neimengense]